jgi:hypothetical protein
LSLHVPALLATGEAGSKAWQWRFYWQGKRVKLTVGQYPERSQSAAHESVREARRLLERDRPARGGPDPQPLAAGRRPGAARVGGTPEGAQQVRKTGRSEKQSKAAAEKLVSGAWLRARQGALTWWA